MYRIFLFPIFTVALMLFTAGQTPAAGTDERVSAAEPAAAAVAEHGEHAAASSDPLSFDSLKRDLAVWSLVIFLIVFGILAKFAFGPIAKALDAREQAVADQIAAAGKANEEAKTILTQYHQKLADSKDEVRQIIETAKQDAEKSAAGIIAKAHGEADILQQRAKKEIEQATVNALQSIAEKSASVATRLAGKLIKAEVRPEQHKDLIEAALNDFSRI
ncbi:MAG: F0F1 ATP synthase subunit B [Planctomycetaceae bacterium]|jgi:F-type H+-transporting ATPase subunit b|nr:F0F1 ATP synthase subunit B [Planctomycetaceae bacterium]